MAKQWTIAGAAYRNRVVRALRRLLDDNREDRLNQIIVDALGDLVLAARAEGFKRDEIRGAIFRGAWHGWADAKAPKSDPSGGEEDGLTFARELGDWPKDWGGARDLDPKTEGLVTALRRLLKNPGVLGTDPDAVAALRAVGEEV